MFSELVDVKENNIVNVDYEILSILLKDRTTNKNIIWATNNYENHGPGYSFQDEITPEKITSYYGRIIRPRIKKSKQEREIRIKEKAEVFTPAWICNLQNNRIDEIWFGYKNVFNKSINEEWIINNNKINFNDKFWGDYVTDIRLEVSCGEAPYLVSRYDAVTGKVLDLSDRIGLLDRKLRVVNENVNDLETWIEWVLKAYKSIYGFEWQGDSLLIARENLLYTFTDNFKYKFNKNPDLELVKKIAYIISWNIWQMDGIKYVIPNSCNTQTVINYTLFGDEMIKMECMGCKKGNNNRHNGIYAKTMNWETNHAIKYITLITRSDKDV